MLERQRIFKHEQVKKMKNPPSGQKKEKHSYSLLGLINYVLPTNLPHAQCQFSFLMNFLKTQGNFIITYKDSKELNLKIFSFHCKVVENLFNCKASVWYKKK